MQAYEVCGAGSIPAVPTIIAIIQKEQYMSSVSIKRPSALTARQLKTLSKLRLPYGELYPNLLLRQNMDDSSARVCLVKQRGKIIGWGLLHYYRSPDFYGLLRPLKTLHPMIQLYVKTEYRRKGYGTKIINRLKKYAAKKVYIFPHDSKSLALYKKVKDSKVTNHPAYSPDCIN